MANFRKSQQAAKGVRVKAVEISAWPHVDDAGAVIVDADGKPVCTHYVRMMKLGELRSFDTVTRSILTTDQVRCGAELLIRTLSDADGNRLYQDDEAPLLDNADWTACMEALAAARELNGLEDKTTKNS